MKVVIVGAGIGGLVTALRLHHHGIDCAVYEQSEQIRELGVGVNLLPHVVGELVELGLLDGLDEIAVRTSELTYALRLGHEIMRRPCGLDAGFTLPQFSVHRGRLQAMLLRAVRERLGAGAVRVGHRLVGFEQDTSVRANVVDRRGEPVDPVYGDVLVGADGIHSTVRSSLFPEEGPPRWNDSMMWRGAVDWPVFGTGRSMIIAGGGPKLVVYPLAEGRAPGTRLTNWVICVPTGRDGDPPPSRQQWSRPADPADLRRHVGLFRIPLLDHTGLVMATQEAFELPMCDRDPLPHWGQGRVTLVGDAAHPMLPAGSNGAGQAILDATSLSGHLAQHADPVDALRAYQRDRLPATSDVVLRNRKSGPERVIDVVEQLAPDGFTDIKDVIDPAELEAIVSGYTQASGASRVARLGPK